MKKIWKIRKDSEAVSPVIATILMVAITVVLAAVLYVMVMGFGGNTAQPPTGDFTTAEKHTSTTERLMFSPFSKDTKPTDIKIIIENVTGATSGTWSFASDASGASLNLVAGGTNYRTGGTIVYTDLAGDAKISNGDYLTITFAAAGSGALSYKATIVWIANGAAVGDVTFSW